MSDKILPRNIDDLALVQKELFISYPNESKSILMALKDIRNWGIDESEVDLLLTEIEETFNDKTIVDKINSILGEKSKDSTENTDIIPDDKSVNHVIVADAPYPIEEHSDKLYEGNEKEEKPLEELHEEQVSQETQEESPKEEESSSEVKEELPFKIKEETQEEISEETQEETTKNEPEDYFRDNKLKSYSKQEDEPEVHCGVQDITRETEYSKSYQERLQTSQAKDVTELENAKHELETVKQEDNKEVEVSSEKEVKTDDFKKAMIDYIVNNLSIAVYRSYKADNDEEVVKAILKEEGYNVN